MNLSMIGPRIQQERKARGMTQSVLAEKVAVSTKYISNIECGEKLPRLETFIAIANALKSHKSEKAPRQLNTHHRR